MSGQECWRRWIPGRLSARPSPYRFQYFLLGSAFVSALVITSNLEIIGNIGGGAGMRAFFLMSVAALPMTCLLWLLLPWRATVPALRKTVTVLFLGSSLLLLSSGGIAALPVVSVSVGNALVVFGLRGGIAYAAITGLYCFIGGLFNPDQGIISSVVSGAVMLLLCLVILVVVIAMIEAHRRAEETAVLLAELKDAHAELRRYAEQARELAIAEERARIARDMHDSIGHYLTVINIGLGNAQRYRYLRPEAAWEEVRQAQELTREALADTRRWVRALRPLRMDGKRGVEALAALVDSFNSADIRLTFTPRGRWPDLDGEREMVCFRVVQEGLTNVLRHAKARNVEVTVDCTSQDVNLSINDDGQGCDGDTAAHGTGLRGLRERVEAVNGTMDIHTGPGEGFRLRVRVPV